MSDRIALAEIPEHIPHLPESARIIALSPAVELELDRTGRDYTRIEDFFDPLDDEKIGMENYPRMETFCTRLDEILRDHIPEIERHNLRPAWWSLYWIKILLDVFFIRGFALERLLDRLQPSEVTYFERTPSGENPVWMDETESTYAVLLDHILPLRNVTAHRLDAFEADKPIPPPTHRQLSTRIRDSLRYRWKMARTFINQRFSRDKKHRLLCLDDRYSLPGILRELEKQDCAYWVWNDENTIKRDGFIPALTLTGTRILSEEEVTRVTNEFQNDHTIRDCLKFGGIDFLDIFIPRLREFTRRIVPETIDYYTNAVHALDELRPHAVLVSKIQFLREKAITEAAHHHDVPVITSRHGELFLRGSPYHRFGESESADWILCWGTWEARWIHRYRTYPAQTPVTGSPMIESSVKDALPRTVIRKQLGFLPTDRIALYAPTSLGGNIWYMGGRQPNDSDYFHQGQRLIQSLLQLEEWKTVIKEHPNATDSLLEKWSRMFSHSGQLSVAYWWFTDCIHLADIIVLDHPATTFIQALAGSAWIYIIYHPLYRWEPGVLDYFNQNGIVVCTIEELETRLRSDEREGKFDQPADYRVSMTPLLDWLPAQSAAKRSADAILDIAAGSVPKSLWEPGDTTRS